MEKKKLKSMIPYLIINAIAFYVLPVLITDTGSAMGMMLFILPLICLITSLIYGIKNSLNIVYPIIIVLLFAPTIFIHYNSSASVYIVAYGVIAMIGNFIGKLFYKK